MTARGKKGFPELWDPSPSSQWGAAPLPTRDRPFPVALALRVRPRAGRARAARDPSSCSMSSTPLGSSGPRVPRTCTVRARRIHRVSRCHTRGARCPARKGDDVFQCVFYWPCAIRIELRQASRPSDKTGAFLNRGEVHV